MSLVEVGGGSGFSHWMLEQAPRACVHIAAHKRLEDGGVHGMCSTDGKRTIATLYTWQTASAVALLLVLLSGSSRLRMWHASMYECERERKQHCSALQATDYLHNLNHHSRVCVVTAVIGNYEHALKEPRAQTRQARFFAFTDRTDLHRSGSMWETIDAVADVQHASKHPEESSLRNSLQRHKYDAFVRGKFYKMQFHRHPRVAAECDVAVWMDASLQITTTRFVEIVQGIMERRNLVVFRQVVRRCVLAVRVV